jgi:uncharacterized lipoprotein YddW (UPF0748 family)
MFCLQRRKVESGPGMRIMKLSSNTHRVFAASLFVLFLAQTAFSQEHRFAWFSPHTHSASGSIQLVEAVRSSGLNGVVLPAVLEGAACFPSQLLPGSPGETGLSELAETSRAAGLSVAVYLQTLIQPGDWESKSHVTRHHKEWLSADWRGEGLEALLNKPWSEGTGLEGLFFDPGLPRVREFLTGLVAEAARHLHPDWVILDLVRYPVPESPGELPRWSQPYGYHVAVRKEFERQWKADPAALVRDESKAVQAFGKERAEVLLAAWKEWRRESVTQFVREVRGMVKVEFPACRLAVVGNPDPYTARELALQDWAGWLREGLTDSVILPDHGPDASTILGMDLLPDDVRSRIWISSPIGKDAVERETFSRKLGRLPSFAGVVLFDASLLQQAELAAALSQIWRTASPAQTATEPIPSNSREEEEPQAKTAPAPVRALYGFQPESEPFKGLTPNQTAQKLKDFGFNAVFGGSSSPALRRALGISGIKRYAEFPIFVGKKHWEQDPECQPVASNGRKIKAQGWYAPVCPSTDWLRKEKLETLLRVLRDQELDGVWLDFIRYPVYWEEVPPFLAETCFCSRCLAGFGKKTGLRPEGNTLAEKAEWILRGHPSEWRRWRADNILEFVSVVSREAKKVSASVQVGAFVLPWKEDDYDNALYRIAGQDIGGFAQIVDRLSPMVYFHELGQKASWVEERAASIARETKIPVLPILQCFDQPTALKPGDLEEAIQASLKAPSAGVILFSQKHLESAKRWDLVKKSLAKEPGALP